MAKKKKSIVQKINPIIIREVEDEIEQVHNGYIPMLEETKIDEVLIKENIPEIEPIIEIEEPIVEAEIPEEIQEEIVIPVEIIAKVIEEPIIEVVESAPIESIAEIPEPKVKAKRVKKEKVVKPEILETPEPESIPAPTPEVLELIQDHDILITNNIEVIEIEFDDNNYVIETHVINPNIDHSIHHRFLELSHSPFELRYKSIKIYDSQTSKYDISFKSTYVEVDGKKYPYSNLRIINK